MSYELLAALLSLFVLVCIYLWVDIPEKGIYRTTIQVLAAFSMFISFVLGICIAQFL